MNSELKTALVQATALLESSLQDLHLYLHLSNTSEAAEPAEVEKLLEVTIACEKTLRNYLDKVQGRQKSRKVKSLLRSLESDSLRRANFSGLADMVRAETDSCCPDNDAC